MPIATGERVIGNTHQHISLMDAGTMSPREVVDYSNDQRYNFVVPTPFNHNLPEEAFAEASAYAREQHRKGGTVVGLLRGLELGFNQGHFIVAIDKKTQKQHGSFIDEQAHACEEEEG